MAGEQWSEAVRSRAAELAADRELGPSEVQRTLREELGASVPTATVVRWVREDRLSQPIDRAAILRQTADRAAILLSSEVRRLERQAPKQRDLGRLDQIARTLKTLQSIEPTKTKDAPKTLADLSGRAEPTAAGEYPADRRAA